MKKELKGIIFDLDGVILDSEKLYLESWKYAVGLQGFELKEETYATSFTGKTIKDCENILLELFNGLDIIEFRNKWKEYFNLYIERQGVPRKKGLNQLLDFLEENGIKKIVATSSDYQDAIACLGELKDRFITIVSGDQIKNGKPAPDIFLKAAEELRLKPEECLVIEDSVAGIKAAHAAGIPSFMVPDLDRDFETAISEISLKVLDSLIDVKEELKKIIC